MKSQLLIIQLHIWQKLIEEECKGPPKEEDLETMAKEVFR